MGRLNMRPMLSGLSVLLATICVCFALEQDGQFSYNTQSYQWMCKAQSSHVSDAQDACVMDEMVTKMIVNAAKRRLDDKRTPKTGQGTDTLLQVGVGDSDYGCGDTNGQPAGKCYTSVDLADCGDETLEVEWDIPEPATNYDCNAGSDVATIAEFKAGWQDAGTNPTDLQCKAAVDEKVKSWIAEASVMLMAKATSLCPATCGGEQRRTGRALLRKIQGGGNSKASSGDIKTGVGNLNQAEEAKSSLESTGTAFAGNEEVEQCAGGTIPIYDQTAASDNIRGNAVASLSSSLNVAQYAVDHSLPPACVCTCSLGNDALQGPCYSACSCQLSTAFRNAIQADSSSWVQSKLESLDSACTDTSTESCDESTTISVTYDDTEEDWKTRSLSRDSMPSVSNGIGTTTAAPKPTPAPSRRTTESTTATSIVSSVRSIFFRRL